MTRGGGADPSGRMRVDVEHELARFRKGLGAGEGNLHGRLGPILRCVCGINDDDIPEEVYKKVCTYMNEKFGRLPKEADKEICECAFNTLGDPDMAGKKLVDRYDILAARGGSPRGTSQRHMRESIIPDLVRMIMADLSHSPFVTPRRRRASHPARNRNANGDVQHRTRKPRGFGSSSC